MPTTTTNNAVLCTSKIATGFQVLNQAQRNDIYRKTNVLFGGRPTFKAAGAVNIYWYWMAPPLGVWASGDAVGSLSVYA
jgi:hypothetical protein